MLLSEVLNSDVPYKVEKSSRTHFGTSATIGGREVVFSASVDDDWTWDISFGEVQGNKKTFAATGSGSELKVGAFVKHSLEEFIGRYTPLTIQFSADTDTRAKMYQRMATRILKDYHGAKAVGLESGGGVYTFTLKPPAERK
jgi:hypothetical protein